MQFGVRIISVPSMPLVRVPCPRRFSESLSESLVAYESYLYHLCESLVQAACPSHFLSPLWRTHHICTTCPRPLSESLFRVPIRVPCGVRIISVLRQKSGSPKLVPLKKVSQNEDGRRRVYPVHAAALRGERIHRRAIPCMGWQPGRLPSSHFIFANAGYQNRNGRQS